MVRSAFMVLSILALATAGCLRGDSGSTTLNPNLLAPKLVLDRATDGRTEVYLHSAFCECAYDSLGAAIDNRTLDSANATYSLDAKTDVTGFFLNATARSGVYRFSFEGRVDILSSDKVRVTDLSGVRPSAPKVFGLPYEHVLERLPEGSP